MKTATFDIETANDTKDKQIKFCILWGESFFVIPPIQRGFSHFRLLSHCRKRQEINEMAIMTADVKYNFIGIGRKTLKRPTIITSFPK